MSSAEVHLKKFRKELHSGIAAMVLLALLERAGEEMYGYQIAKEIGAKAGGASFLKQGAIYPVLRSLHAGGLLESRVEVSMSGPPRRYYAISKDGREALEAWRGVWSDLREFVDGLVGPGGANG
ncbi:MAG: PadR family transcriptional regulator [Alphaproteobacteria bacterium]|nr:PadR family transcriptional regulator [Alphaproteobacteria bacterium]